MVIARTGRAQLPAVGQSQDRVFTTDHAAIVLDGASAFEPGGPSAATYVDELGKRIADALDAAPAADLKAVLAAAIADTATVGPDADRFPASTVGIVRVSENAVDLLALGDTPIFYGDRSANELRDTRMADLRFPESAEYRRRLEAGLGYDDAHRELLSRLQRRQRSLRNRPDGWWIASEDPNAAGQALTRRVPATDIAWVVVATDGAANTICHLGLDDWPKLSSAGDRELRGILERCHRWEAEMDADGRYLPRSKRHDDKTLVALRLGPGSPRAGS